MHDKLLIELTEYRRHLHRIPEAGLEELKTANFIKSKLDEWHIDYESEIASTGIVAFINGSDGNKTIAFRADMDALSLTEQANHEYVSNHKGMMHACGHDGHMANLLGLINVLKDKRENLINNVVFIFQPAEEGPGGADLMVKEGILEKYKVDEIVGLHIYPDVPQGKYAVRSGPLMAMTGEFDIEIIGKSGHGAIPHKANDAIIMAADLMQKLQSVVSRFVSPIDAGVLTVGKLVAGERRNIIAETAVLEGTMRAFKDEVYQTIRQRLIDYSKSLEVAYGCTVNVVIRDMYPPVVNDDGLTRDFIEAVGQDRLFEIDPQMTAEDFSYFQREVPGLFFFLGSRNEEKGHVFPLHNSKFDFDESILLDGLKAFLSLLRVKGYLND